MKRIGTTLLLLLVPASACRETTLVPPRSLDSPSALAVARGEVCLSTFEDAERVVQYELGPCADGERGAIGLVTNEQSDRLALMDLNAVPPRLVDLDPATPGPNHLEVGRLPVDVAVSPDGTVAYTLNQLDRDVSLVDLYAPAVLAQRYAVDETPIALEVDPGSGEVVVAAGSPSRLYGFPGLSYCGPDEPCEESPDPAEVSPRVLDLPGTVSGLTFDPRGGDAWIVYRDLGYASVVSFAPTPDGFDTPCLNGIDDKPCVIAQVSLTFECADGLDNDGDGRVDQQDAQCFGPRGAESPVGLGRVEVDACANGLDDDGDGLTDRDDPECVFASGLDEAAAPVADAPVFACADAIDNDDDGAVDYPNDPACYGPVGRTETAVAPRGFDAVGTDSHGVFVYVVDRSHEQVLVIDARKKRLVDAPAAELPAADALDTQLGVDVAPSPLAVHGAIERSVQWRDPQDDQHVVVRYDLGAWVSANNGTVQYVDAAVTFCEFTGEVVDRAAFFRGEQGPEEERCLELPAFPLPDAPSRVVATDARLPAACTTAEFVECATCLAAGELVCEACVPFSATQFDLCQRAFEGDGVVQYVNPRFALRDGGGDDGRLLGTGTCEQPDALVRAMQEFAQANPTAPQDLKCDSLLMPQPLHPDAFAVAPDDTAALQDLPRAALFELRTLQFDTESAPAPFVGFRPSDQRIVNEAVTTTYEGVIPGTARADAVFAEAAEADGSIWVDVGFNPCSLGVIPGDRFLVTAAPLDGCEVTEDLEYEVVETSAGELRIAPVDGLAEQTPVRACFETGASTEVRASASWTVVGETSGFISPFESVAGVCVPRYGAARLGSRVGTGELYAGPYYSFYMYPGFAGDAVAPVRDTSVTFQVTSGFLSTQFPTCSSLGQQCAAGLFPTQVLWAPGLPAGTLLLAPDPNDDFIHVRNLDDAAAGYTVVR